MVVQLALATESIAEYYVIVVAVGNESFVENSESEIYDRVDFN